MNGAVQGEATTTASTPERKSSTRGWRARRPPSEAVPGMRTSKRPARFSPISVNSAASAATTAGDCNWKPQPSCDPAARRASMAAPSARNEASTPAV